MELYIGSDHAGYEFKAEVISHILQYFSDYDLYDCGVYSDESVDYPDYAQKVCDKVLNNPNSLGILICGTGIGMSIAANKIKGIRAALCNDTYSAKLSRQHNNANVLVMGSRVVGYGVAEDIIENFLNSKFLEGRHAERLNLIKEIENKN